MRAVYNIIILLQLAVNCSAEVESNESIEFLSSVMNKKQSGGTKDVLQADNSEGMILSEAGTILESFGETQNDNEGQMNKALEKNHIQEIVCNNDKTFGGRVKCDNYTLLVKRGYWIGDNEHNITVVAFCKFCQIFYTKKTGLFIPVKPEENQCLENRTHFLCSQCQKNSAPAINSRHYECIDCKWWKVFLYIIGNFIGFFFLSAFIFVFDFFPGSGALNALVFFSQMITSTLQLDGGGMVPLSAVTNNTKLTNGLDYAYYVIYGIWNLDFIDPVSSFCFSRNFTTVDVLAMKYGIAIIFLVPVLFFVIFSNFYDNIYYNTCGRNCASWFGENVWNCIRCSCCPFGIPWLKKLIRFNKQQSIKSLVSSCLLLSFTKFTVTTFYLINPTEMYDATGHRVGKVLYYQGNIDYFGEEHLKYAIVAILVFVTFVAGFPLMLLLLRYEHEPTNTTTSDQESRRGSRTRTNRCTARLKSILLYLSTLLDECVLKSFQKDLRWGKRKDRPCCGFKFWRFSFGLHDYRWYAGWYFFLRLSLFAAYIFPMDFLEQLIIQQLLCVLGLVISISFRPYRYWFYNRLDGFILVLLIFINTLVLYQYYLTATDQSLSMFAFMMQYTLVYVPAISMIVYFFIKIVRNYFKDENEETQPDNDFEDTQTTTTVVQPSPLNISYAGSEGSRRLTMSANQASEYRERLQTEVTVQQTPTARAPGVLEKFKNHYLCSCYNDSNTTYHMNNVYSSLPENPSIEQRSLEPSSSVNDED